MDLELLQLVGVMRHKSTCRAFPPRGVVLVTGANGQGKSSLVEAVSFALWGKTLRGTPLWTPGVEVHRVGVSARFQGGPVAHLAVERTPSKLRVAPGEVVGGVFPWLEPFETTTKALKYVEGVVGPWDVWRKCSVLSSADSALFTLANDGERKRLLEVMIGIDRFDAPLKACRADMVALRQEITANERTLAVLTERRRGLLMTLTELEDVLGKKVGTDSAAKAEMLARAEIHLSELQQAQALRVSAVAEARAAYQQACDATRTANNIRAKAREKKGACPVCLRPFAVEVTEEEWLALCAQYDQASAAEYMARTHLEGLQVEVRAEAPDLTAAQAQVRIFAAAKQQAEVAVSVAKGAAQRVEKLRGENADVEEQWEDTDRLLGVQRTRLAVLEACEDALGTKGLRAHMLAAAVGALQQLANGWLVRLSSADALLQVQLASYTEKADGGLTERLSFEVTGAGAGYGYKAASGGERRRVDLAVLLALWELRSANAGVRPGTLFFDEVFDAIDDEGIELAARVVEGLAVERCCVVISHNERLAEVLNCVERWHVTDGVVRVDD